MGLARSKRTPRVSYTRILGLIILSAIFFYAYLEASHILVTTMVEDKYTVYTQKGLRGMVREIIWDKQDVILGTGGLRRNGSIVRLGEKGEITWSINTSSPIMFVSLDGSGDKVLAASKDGYIYVVNRFGGTVLGNTILHTTILSADLNKKKNLLVLGTGYPMPGYFIVDMKGRIVATRNTGEEVYGVRWSHNGSLLAICASTETPLIRGEFWVYDASGNVVYYEHGTREFWNAYFSPDDNLLAVTTGFPHYSLLLYNSGRGMNRVYARYLGGVIWNVEWIGNYLSVVIGRPGDRITIIDAQRGVVEESISVPKGDVGGASWSHNRRHLATVNRVLVNNGARIAGALYVFNSHGELEWQAGLEGGGTVVSWSPGDRYLAVGTRNGEIYVYDTGALGIGPYETGISFFLSTVLFIASLIILYRARPGLFVTRYL